LKQALRWFSPLKILDRKYADATQAHTGMQRAMNRLLERRERLLEQNWLRLRAQAGAMLHASERTLEQCAASLRAFDPHAPLVRGYALAYDGRGHLLRSVHDAKKGGALRLRLRDGTVDASINGIREETSGAGDAVLGMDSGTVALSDAGENISS
jgi:exodeoxyribonuclease VII large subunit